MARRKESTHLEPLGVRLKRLDKIIEKLSGGDLTLDETERLFAEGMELVKNCRSELKDVRSRIERLNRATGTTETIDPESLD